jgi:NCS2 family nucleobase:cation symporter-2
MWMPHAIHPLIESGILLASMSAVALNAFFNGTSGGITEARDAAFAAGSGGH